ncbi:MAG: hypothetical protein ACTSQJ_00420 [Promethearchaeota archaeon]
MKDKKNRPDCYKCKYKGNLPGSAHICCKHPVFKPILDDPIGQLFSAFASVRIFPPVLAIGKIGEIGEKAGIVVKGDPHGIRNGWFNHPFNFDPVWLLECTGFEKKEEVKEK